MLKFVKTTSGDANATTTTGAGGVQNIFAIYLHILNIYILQVFKKLLYCLAPTYGMDSTPNLRFMLVVFLPTILFFTFST